MTHAARIHGGEQYNKGEIKSDLSYCYNNIQFVLKERMWMYQSSLLRKNKSLLRSHVERIWLI